ARTSTSNILNRSSVLTTLTITMKIKIVLSNISENFSQASAGETASGMERSAATRSRRARLTSCGRDGEATVRSPALQWDSAEIFLVSVVKWARLRSKHHSPARDPHGREKRLHNQ